MKHFFAFIAAVGAMIARGFWFSYGWGWYVVPLGLPGIGIVHAMGLSMLLGAISIDPFAKHDEEYTWAFKSWCLLVINLYIWLMLWIVSFWV